MVKLTPCKFCGKWMIWGTDTNGKSIPLDPAPPIYHVISDNDGGQLKIRLAEKDETGRRSAMISHSAICTERERFSKNK